MFVGTFTDLMYYPASKPKHKPNCNLNPKTISKFQVSISKFQVLRTSKPNISSQWKGVFLFFWSGVPDNNLTELVWTPDTADMILMPPDDQTLPASACQMSWWSYFRGSQLESEMESWYQVTSSMFSLLSLEVWLFPSCTGYQTCAVSWESESHWQSENMPPHHHPISHLTVIWAFPHTRSSW